MARSKQAVGNGQRRAVCFIIPTFGNAVHICAVLPSSRAHDKIGESAPSKILTGLLEKLAEIGVTSLGKLLRRPKELDTALVQDQKASQGGAVVDSTLGRNQRLSLG